MIRQPPYKFPLVGEVSGESVPENSKHPTKEQADYFIFCDFVTKCCIFSD